MGSGALVWVLEQEELYGEKARKGVFSSIETMIDWIQMNVGGPIAALQAYQEVVDQPNVVGGTPLKFRRVDGRVVVVKPE